MISLIDPTALAPLAAQHPYLFFIGIVVCCLSQITVAVAKTISAWLKQSKPTASSKPPGGDASSI
jgi:hypothetical protein